MLPPQLAREYAATVAWYDQRSQYDQAQRAYNAFCMFGAQFSPVDSIALWAEYHGSYQARMTLKGLLNDSAGV
jgi:hypothetical protein